MHYELEPEDFDPDETLSDRQLTYDIDQALARVRPERYAADEKEWMEPVIAKVRDELGRRNSNEVYQDVARRRVYRREAEATKHTNRILRDIDQTGQLPLGWGEGDNWKNQLYDILHLPLSIARKRVRLGVAEAQDLDQWDKESAREEDKRRAAQNAARSGARLLITWLMEQPSARRVDDLKPGGAQELGQAA